MSFVSNYLHCVWGTKHMVPYFTEQNTRDILWHILNKARENDIWIDNLNAYRDHMHCLLSLKPDQCLSQVIKQIKGESSYWINRNVNLERRFQWGPEYYASSVSSKILPVVREYIRNQEHHHRDKSWEQEQKEYQTMITRLLKPFRLDR